MFEGESFLFDLYYFFFLPKFLFNDMISVMDRIPCHKMFIAHYEHVLADATAYHEPLADFMEFDSRKREVKNDSSLYCAQDLIITKLLNDWLKMCCWMAISHSDPAETSDQTEYW